jgi:hypothetical protein
MSQKQHYSMNRKGGDTQEELRKDGRTNFTLKIKEGALHVTV